MSSQYIGQFGVLWLSSNKSGSGFSQTTMKGNMYMGKSQKCIELIQSAIISIAVLLLVVACTNEIEVNGKKVALSECRQDIKKLEQGIDVLLAIGKRHAERHMPADLMIQEIAVAESSMASEYEKIPTDIGPCGELAVKAFNIFEQDFLSALSVEYEPYFLSRPPDSQQGIKASFMEKLTNSRKNLDAEMRALKTLVKH